jgi:hypothetical protein
VDYLGKGEMLTIRDVNEFVHKIGQNEAFCAYGKLAGSFISAHETWGPIDFCSVFFCSV